MERFQNLINFSDVLKHLVSREDPDNPLESISSEWLHDCLHQHITQLTTHQGDPDPTLTDMLLIGTEDLSIGEVRLTNHPCRILRYGQNVIIFPLIFITVIQPTK